MLKEILFVSYHFPPFSKILSIRAAEFTKRLVNNGYKIFVVSAKSNKNAHKDKELLKKVNSPLIKNTRVFNLSFAKEGFQSNIKKTTLYFEIFNLVLFLHWIPFAFLASRRIIKKNNLRMIYVSAPPFFTLPLGYLLKFFYKIPLIIEYRDPWSYNPYLKDTMTKSIEKFYLKMEKKILKSADRIIAISEGMKEFLIDNFPEVKSNIIHAIPHGINVDEIEKKSNIPKEITFTFTGNLYGLRDLEPLVKIVSTSHKLGKFNDTTFNINIFGRYDSKHLKSLFKKYNVSKYFHLEGFVPRDVCLKEVYNSSLALHVGENLNYPTLSFKVLEYLSMRKKIVYIGREDSYTAKFLEKYGLGTTLPINSIEIGISRFEELLEGIKSGEINTVPDSKDLQEFTWDKRTNDLIKIFNLFRNNDL
ncbi:MAG: glycosyltransferase [Promethearchaeota archaeon]